MDFNQYINQSWSDHAKDPQSVFESFAVGETLITSNDNIPVLVRLIKHVSGDHLGLWQSGIEKLTSLKLNPHFKSGTESDFSILRSVATLELCSGQMKDLGLFSVSDQIRILASAAAALAERGSLDNAKDFFVRSLELAARGLANEDPAHRDLAVTGNNLACSLEEKANRSEFETELMILASKTGRKFWELAGGPSEIASAEYRLSQSYLQASQIEKSFEHAQICVELCEEHRLSAVDHFYGFEAIALAEKARKNEMGYSLAVEKLKHHFAQMSDDDRKWCEKTMNRFS